MFEFFIAKFGSEFSAAMGGATAGLLLYGLRTAWKLFKQHRHKLRKHKREQEIPTLVKQDIGVYRDLTELLVETKSDRAYVMQFHNGSYYVNQGNQMKLSCTHEIVRSGVSREQDNMQNFLVSKFAAQLDRLSQSKSAIYNIAEDDETYFGQMNKSQGVSTFIASFIKDGNLIEGMVIINYLVGNDPEDKNLEKYAAIVEDVAGKVGYLLRNQDYE